MAVKMGRCNKQKQRLVSRLAELVRKYPMGLPLIKEFLQNADDAGATIFRVIYDRRTHKGSFPDDQKEMNIALNPSLLFFNNEGFTEENLDGITNLGEGDKANDAGKTGRFGQGFNTCYSVTDHPSFRTTVYKKNNDNNFEITKNTIVWFDPHERIKFENDENELDLEEAEKNWPALVPTFEVALPNRNNNERFTIFRLPLRSGNDILRSQIKNEAFSENHFKEILENIQKIGPALLVFLRSVTSLEIQEMTENGTLITHYSIVTLNEK